MIESTLGVHSTLLSSLLKGELLNPSSVAAAELVWTETARTKFDSRKGLANGNPKFLCAFSLPHDPDDLQISHAKTFLSIVTPSLGFFSPF